MWPILSRLYLGDREDARDRDRLVETGITHVVNCARELPSHLESEFTYLRLNLDDPDPGFRAALAPVCAFIDRGRTEGGVLVHCTAAVSRGPAVVLAYLCHHGEDLEDAAARLSRGVLSGIDPIFLKELAIWRGRALKDDDLKRLSLILLGRIRRKQPPAR